jgi:hypothetical protein
MSLRIDDFKSKLTGGGARANLFKAIVNYGAGINGNNELSSFMCKAATLPASILPPVEIPFRGKKLKIAGDREFEPWTITIINDTNFSVRDSFEEWSNAINGHSSGEGLVNPSAYMADMAVQQLDKDGSVLKTYELRGCYPSNISSIELSYDSENTIEEFTVELQVQYWDSNTTS